MNTFSPHKNPENSITMLSEGEFEDLYLSVRKRESRIYTDDELKRLPDIRQHHVHAPEWKIRQRSCDRLVTYLKKLHQPLTILEVGCGNGWLSHQLSKILNSTVVGIDINHMELEQAKRVFGEIHNLSFIHADLQKEFEPGWQFDCIIFAASIQYFSSLPGILSSAKDHLETNGEIHIIDSHFYNPGEIAEAKKRSDAYYASMEVPRMSDFYFHHSEEEIQQLHPETIHFTTSFYDKLIAMKHPFPWIRIKKKEH